MFLFRKNKKLLDMLESYLAVVSETLQEFSLAFHYLMENGIDEHFKVLGSQTHKKESNADDLRRDIELLMYEKSLLPESRRDLLEVIEMIDKIPNRAESILSMHISQRLELKDEIKEDMEELLKLSLETVKYVIQMTNACFKGDGDLNKLARLIDNNESLGDHLERKMVEDIFSLQIDTGEKILQKDSILQVGAICDLSEAVKDKLVITNIKRSV